MSEQERVRTALELDGLGPRDLADVREHALRARRRRSAGRRSRRASRPASGARGPRGPVPRRGAGAAPGTAAAGRVPIRRRACRCAPAERGCRPRARPAPRVGDRGPDPRRSARAPRPARGAPPGRRRSGGWRRSPRPRPRARAARARRSARAEARSGSPGGSARMSSRREGRRSRRGRRPRRSARPMRWVDSFGELVITQSAGRSPQRAPGGRERHRRPAQEEGVRHEHLGEQRREPGIGAIAGCGRPVAGRAARRWRRAPPAARVRPATAAAGTPSGRPCESPAAPARGRPGHRRRRS